MTTKKQPEDNPLASARKAYAQAKSRESEASDRVGSLRSTPEAKRTEGYAVDLLSAELAQARLQQETWQAGVVLDAALRADASSADDPRVRAASVECAISDAQALLDEAARLRQVASEAIATAFGSGVDVTTKLAELATLDSAAKQADALAFMRLEHGCRARVDLLNERHAAGDAPPPPFPSRGNFAGASDWIAALREHVKAPPEAARAGHLQKIAKLERELRVTAAAIEKRRVDEEEARAFHAREQEAKRRVEERRAAVRAEERAQREAAAQAAVAREAELARAYLERHGA